MNWNSDLLLLFKWIALLFFYIKKKKNNLQLFAGISCESVKLVLFVGLFFW